MKKGLQIGQGRTAEIFAWGEDRILKLFQSWMPQHIVEQEYKITRAAQAAGLPVPATEELVEMDGRFGIVFERILGSSLLKNLENKPWTLAEVARQMAELHARIGSCAMPPEFPAQRAQIEAGLAAAKGLPEAKKEAVRRHLAHLPAGDTLCHGDFHPDNILVSERGPVIIDWLTGTRGNRFGDVARTAIILKTGGLPPRIPVHVRIVMNISRSLLCSMYLRRYLQLHPAKPQQVACWELPLTAARLCEVEEYPQEKSMLLKRLDRLLSRQAGSAPDAL